MLLAKIPETNILSIMPTFQCNAACANCGTLSHPKAKGTLTEDQILTAIDQAAAQKNYSAVAFTGGEPMMRPDLVYAGVSRAQSYGLPTRIVTNGFWAKSEERACAVISELVDAGLTEINFSTGDEHVKWVPLSQVIRGLRIGLDKGLTAALMIEMRKGGRLSKAKIQKLPSYRSAFPNKNGLLPRVIESPWMPVDPDLVDVYPEGVAVTHENVFAQGGCDSVLTTTTLLSDGNIAACCGLGVRKIPELNVGHIDEDSLEDIATAARNDLVKAWIQVEGPFAILDWASSRDPKIKWSGQYAHKCQACLRLYSDPKVRRVVRENYEEKLGDIVFSKLVLFEKPSSHMASKKSQKKIEK